MDLTHFKTSRAINRLVLLLALAWAPAVFAAESPPNIVLIFTDDQGYADVGKFGAVGFQTPNLDRMADEGAIFRNFHVAQPVCSASRAAILTGCYPNRIGIHGALGPHSRIGLGADEMTLAQLVKQRGYATAIFGKWHLGDAPQFMPLHHGFDEFFGLPLSVDYWPGHPDLITNFPPTLVAIKREYPNLPIYDGDRIFRPEMSIDDLNHLTTWYTERAVNFIERNKSHPFFLYVAHSMPHVPLGVSDKFRGRTKRGLYGDVIEEMTARFWMRSSGTGWMTIRWSFLPRITGRGCVTEIMPVPRNHCAKGREPIGKAARVSPASCASPDIFPPGRTPGTC